MQQDTRQFDVELRDVSFYAYHGLYEEERINGNNFSVDLNVKFARQTDKLVSDIQDTINYVRLFEIVKAEMDTPQDLLETVAMLIAGKIKQEFLLINEVSVRITKLGPPIRDFSGKVSVNYTHTYKIGL